MHDDSHAESVHVQLINSLSFVIGDNLWSYEAWSTAFCKNNVLLVMESRQAVVNDL